MNNNINEDYVSFETAKLLKKMGFDCHCDSFYYGNTPIEFVGNYNSEDQESGNPHHSRPSLSLAIKWVWENFGIWIEVYMDDDKTFGYLSTQIIPEGRLDHPLKRGFSTPAEAGEEGLLYTLKNLVK